MMEVESYGWREKLRALREKPKPQTPSTARKSRVAFLPSAHQRLSHSPSLGDLSSILRKRDQSSAKQSRSTDFSTHSCKNSLNDGCPYPSEYYLGKHMMHQIGGAVSHDTQNTLTCPTVSDRRVPECLDTSSDFFNPAVSAEERFEKYLNEMHRREHQIELFEKRKLATTTIGHPKVSVTGRDNFDKIKIERSRYKGMAGSHPMRILPDIKRSSSLDSDPQTKPLNTIRTKLADGELLTVKTLLTQPDVETATKPKEIKYKLFYTTR